MKVPITTVVLLLIHVTLSNCWFFESPEHPTRREEELESLSDVSPEDLEDIQLFLTYKPYFLEYARQQMARKNSPSAKRTLPFIMRSRTVTK